MAADRISRRWCLGLLTIIGLLTGCAGLTSRWPVSDPELPPRRVLTGVDFIAQDEYQCGPAALAMGLGWSGLAVSPQELTPMVYTASRRGSLQPAMIAAARRWGRVAYVIKGPEALLDEVAAGHPVIVLQNLGFSWAPLWHYAVVIGYDRPADEVVLHTGLSAGRRTDWALFLNTWSRGGEWGLLVLNPEELPVTAGEGSFLEAVIGLEHAGRFDEAARAYRTALARWPGSLGALMGLGNSEVARGDLGKAAAAFREAAAAHPQSGAAWNNLAHVLMKQGRKEEALDAAQRAVALGGPQSATFRQTLEEIGIASP